MKIKALILLTTIFAGSAFAATPTDKSLEELSKVSYYEDVFYQAIISPLNMERMAIAQGLAQDNTLTDTQRQQALQTFDNYAQGLLQTLDTPATKEALKKAYMQSAKNFTQAEVNAQLAFYGSKDGQSAVAKQNGVLDDYLTKAGEANQSTIKSYEDKNLQKMQDDIKKILGK